MRARARMPNPDPETPTPFSLACDVETALERLAAALWLIDSLEVGELCFLGSNETAPAQWWGPTVFPMTGGELAGWLMHMAREYSATALDEGHVAATALRAALRPAPAEAAR